MSPLRRSEISFAVSFCGGIVVGFCVGFLYEKLRKQARKRESNMLVGELCLMEKRGKSKENDADKEMIAVLDKVHEAENLIAAGDIEEGIEKLSNVVLGCAAPTQCLKALERLLPGELYIPLAEKVKACSSTTSKKK
ncbi:hypothetical protein C0J52_03585 [Blattella germanica]|nr:hypothetical protein C0J52_03585 [Blattella germanica]